METLKEIAGIALAFVIFFFLFGTVGCDREALHESYLDGYDEGYEEGYEIGHEHGYDDGLHEASSVYESGFEAGRSEGYEEGYGDSEVDHVTNKYPSGMPIPYGDIGTDWEIYYTSPWDNYYHTETCHRLTVPLPIRYANAIYVGLLPCDICRPGTDFGMPPIP